MKTENVVDCPPCGESTLKGGKGGVNKGNLFDNPPSALRATSTADGEVNGGFTLIELLVVVLIIAILAAVAVPQYQKSVEKSRAMQALILLKAMAQAQKSYYLANGVYATKFDQLDVDLPAWSGNTAWIASEYKDIRSNDEWSLQLMSHAIYIGRILGKYKGIGFMYWLDDSNANYPQDTLICYEREDGGVTFDGKRGDYCQKIMGGARYNNATRVYTLPY